MYLLHINLEGWLGFYKVESSPRYWHGFPFEQHLPFSDQKNFVFKTESCFVVQAGQSSYFSLPRSGATGVYPTSATSLRDSSWRRCTFLTEAFVGSTESPLVDNYIGEGY
jgi:hypothetical protein